MLHLIPAPLHRLGYRLAHRLRVTWWRIARPRITGCRVVALDVQGRVLLIRHSYGSGNWMLPGGAVGRGEDALAAALRELAEETACSLHDAAEVAQADERLHGARNRVHVIVGQTGDHPEPDRREVIAAAFFALDALPAPLAGGIAERLPGWITAAKAAVRQA